MNDRSAVEPHDVSGKDDAQTLPSNVVDLPTRYVPTQQQHCLDLQIGDVIVNSNNDRARLVAMTGEDRDEVTLTIDPLDDQAPQRQLVLPAGRYVQIESAPDTQFPAPMPNFRNLRLETVGFDGMKPVVGILDPEDIRNGAPQPILLRGDIEYLFEDWSLDFGPDELVLKAPGFDPEHDDPYGASAVVISGIAPEYEGLTGYDFHGCNFTFAFGEESLGNMPDPSQSLSVVKNRVTATEAENDVPTNPGQVNEQLGVDYLG